MKEKIQKLTEEIKKELKDRLSSPDFQEVLEKIKSSGDSGTFEVVVSTNEMDRQGEIIDQNGWELDFYRMNPIVLWAHDYNSLPIGVCDEIFVKDGKLIARGRFAPEEANPFAQQVRKLYDMKIVRATSVGLIPKEVHDGVITKAELLEFSFVPVPANPFALSLKEIEKANLNVSMLKMKGLNISVKASVPFEETAKAPEDREWDVNRAEESLRRWASSDGSGDPDKIDWEKYRRGFAWYDAENKETFGAYKLPHHEVIDGELKVVWRGVAAAMAALMGARGGVDIPNDEWDSVYNHLAKHYKQFEKEPPEKKEVVITKPEPEVTDNYIIIRVKDPEYFDQESFRTIDISVDKGIKATIGCKNGEFSGGKCNIQTEVQRFLFDRDKWTIEDAQRWVDEHKSESYQTVDTEPSINVSKAMLVKEAIDGMKAEINQVLEKYSGEIIKYVDESYSPDKPEGKNYIRKNQLVKEKIDQLLESIAALQELLKEVNLRGGEPEEGEKENSPGKTKVEPVGLEKIKADLDLYIAVRNILRGVDNAIEKSLRDLKSVAKNKITK